MVTTSELTKMYQNAIDVLEIMQKELRTKDIQVHELQEAYDGLFDVSNFTRRFCAILQVIIFEIKRDGFNNVPNEHFLEAADEAERAINLYQETILIIEEDDAEEYDHQELKRVVG